MSICDPRGLHGILHAHPTCQTIRFYQCGGECPEYAVSTKGMTFDTITVKERDGATIQDHVAIFALMRPEITVRIRRLEWSFHENGLCQRLSGRLRLDDVPGVCDLGDALDYLGQHLQELRIMIYPEEPWSIAGGMRTDIHSLAPATGLRRLEFFCPGNTACLPRTWITDTLETLCFISRGSIHNYLRSLEWERIDHTLARLLRTIPRLKFEFEFRRVSGTWKVDEVKESVLELLPSIAAAGARSDFSLNLLRPTLLGPP